MAHFERVITEDQVLYQHYRWKLIDSATREVLLSDDKAYPGIIAAREACEHAYWKNRNIFVTKYI